MKFKGKNNGLSRHAPFRNYIQALRVPVDDRARVVALVQLLIAARPVRVVLGFEGQDYSVDRIDPVSQNGNEYIWHLHTACPIRGHLPGWFVLSGSQKEASVTFGAFDDLTALGTALDSRDRTPDEQAAARYRLAATGYLTVRASLSTEAENQPVTLLSSIAELQSVYDLYRAHPDRHRWLALIAGDYSVSEAVPASARDTQQGVELRFSSHTAKRDYTVQITANDGVVTGAVVRYAGTPQTPLYEAAGIRYNTTTGYYELNGLLDLTEQHAAAIFIAGPLQEGVKFQYGGALNKALPTDVRTNLCYPSWFNGTTLTEKYRGNVSLEIALIISSRERHDPEANSNYYTILKDTRLSYCFDSCVKLRKVIGVLDCTFVSSGSDGWYCPMLEEIYLWGVVGNFNMKDAPRLAKASILYMIRHAAPSGPITMIYHPEVYARAMADTDVQQALAEQPLVALASA